MMRQRTSTYSKMYLVSPAIYERLLNCLDDSEKMQTEEQNKPGEDPPKRPSEQIIENIHMEEIRQPLMEEIRQPLPAPPPPPRIYPDLNEELHRERMGGTLYPRLEEEPEYISPEEEILGVVHGPPTSVVPQPPSTDPWSELEREIELTGGELPALPPPARQRAKKSVRFGIPIAKFQEQVALKQRQRLQKVKPLRKYRYATPPIIEPIQQLQVPVTPQVPTVPRPNVIPPPMPVQHIVTQEAFRQQLAKQACGKNQLCGVKRQRLPKNVCPICGRAFGRSWNLSRHMSDVHSRLPDEDYPIEDDRPLPEQTFTEQFASWHPPMALKNPYKRPVRRTKFYDPYYDKVQKLDGDRERFERWLGEPD